MSDKIEKRIFIKGTRERVFRALSEKSEFGKWFGVDFPAGSFRAGEKVRGQITIPAYAHVAMNIEIVEVVPPEKLSYKWRPYAVDPKVDYSTENLTLVTFTLEEAEGGTQLTVVESGFDQIPLHRRAEAFRMNDQGWAAQVKNIERHVTAA